MFGFMRRRRTPKRHHARTPSPEEINHQLERFECLRLLNRDEQNRLRVKSAEILARMDFLGAKDYVPDYAACLTVAAMTALPLLNRRLSWLRDFRSFILYEERFSAETTTVDDAGVVHRGRDLRAGEAWHRGPVVLAMSDVERSGQGTGFNVVVHEIVHQIDYLNRDPDGFPPLPRSLSSDDWAEHFGAGYALLQSQLQQHQQPWLDPYGATNPAEFFAVCSECFFDLPVYLKQQQPELYRLLSAFFDQDPAARQT
ncbi:MAG: M90 family metallopeptidase [Pseudomonadota bacterium]